MPWHVAKIPGDLHPVGCVLGIKRVCIFDKEVCVEQFVRIFVRIGRGRLGTAKVNRVLVTRHNGVDRWILPRPLTLEAKLVLVIGERAENVRGEEQRRDLTDHWPSVPRPFRDHRTILMAECAPFEIPLLMLLSPITGEKRRTFRADSQMRSGSSSGLPRSL